MDQELIDATDVLRPAAGCDAHRQVANFTVDLRGAFHVFYLHEQFHHKIESLGFIPSTDGITVAINPLIHH